MTVRLPRLPRRGRRSGQRLCNYAGRQGRQPGRGRGPRRRRGCLHHGSRRRRPWQEAFDLFRRERIDVSHVRVCEGVSSGVALIFVGDDGENMIGVASGANHMLSPEDIDRLPDSVFRRETCCWRDWKSPIETAARAIGRGSRAGMRVILNPAPVPDQPEAITRACSRSSTCSRRTASRHSRWRG